MQHDHGTHTGTVAVQNLMSWVHPSTLSVQLAHPKVYLHLRDIPCEIIRGAEWKKMFVVQKLCLSQSPNQHGTI